MKELFRRLSIVLEVAKVSWRCSSGGRGVHYHLFGFGNLWEYLIAWTELHEAQLKYERRIRAKAISMRRKRNKSGQFI